MATQGKSDGVRFSINLMTGVVIIPIALGMMLIITSPSFEQSQDSANGRKHCIQAPVDDACLDIAVVGAGIGGSYLSWKLRKRGLSIALFEYSDRVGGRLFNPPLPAAPGTYMDFGAKRFYRDWHPIFAKVSKELGLKIIPFPLNFGNAEETMWYMRDTHMRNTDLGTSKMPYNLDPKEMTDPDTLLWNIYNENVNFSTNTDPNLSELYSITKKDGTPVYKMSYENFLGDTASREAIRYIRDTYAWADGVGPHGALHGAKMFVNYPGNTKPFKGLSTIEGGMDRVPKAMVRQFLKASSRHKLHLNYQLMGVERRPSGGYNLRIRKTQTEDGMTSPAETNELEMCSRKVVLAAQKGALEDIEIPVFKNNPEIMTAFDSVVGYTAGKFFLAYENKWWKSGNEDITHTRTDLPNGQTYDWQTGSNNVSVLLASYHDGEMTRHWRELSEFGSPIPGSLPGAYAVTDVVKERLEKYLGRIFNIKQEDIPPAVGGGMMLWDSYPHYYAWEFFKPGFDERHVRPIIQRPSREDDIYIVSNSWASGDLAVWAEGSLTAAQEVLDSYFR